MKYFITQGYLLQSIFSAGGTFLVGEIQKINNLELAVKVYQNQRVITFKDI